MVEKRQANNGQCPSPGVLMALLDGQLEGRERSEALAHLESCQRCQELSRELRATSSVLASQLACPDDERIAAYVDQRAGRVRGALTEAEVSRMKAHLAECSRCRAEVKMLARDARVGTGILDWIRRLLLGRAGQESPGAAPALRWAVLAVAAVAAVVFLWVGLQSGRGPDVSDGTHRVVQAPDEVTNGTREEQSAPSETRSPDIAGPLQPGTAPDEGTGADRGAPGVPPPPSRVAFMPGEEEVNGSLTGALAELERAEKAGRAGDEAVAARTVADIYHKEGNHRLAASYYRRAADAAEQAGLRELRIDVLILSGAALAELGEAKEAREQLDDALRLARDAGYRKGEENALVQIELLEADAGEGES